jgi:transposase
LSDDAWAVIEPQLPNNQLGPRRVDDRRVISGIIHMLKGGGHWADCPAKYGPPTTIYNRWNRWSRRGIWPWILAALTEDGWIAETARIDSSDIKPHRCADGERGPKANARNYRSAVTFWLWLNPEPSLPNLVYPLMVHNVLESEMSIPAYACFDGKFDRQPLRSAFTDMRMDISSTAKWSQSMASARCSTQSASDRWKRQFAWR